jgi:hypothetical protein
LKNALRWKICHAPRPRREKRENQAKFWTRSFVEAVGGALATSAFGGRGVRGARPEGEDREKTKKKEGRKKWRGRRERQRRRRQGCGKAEQTKEKRGKGENAPRKKEENKRRTIRPSELLLPLLQVVHLVHHFLD